MLKQLREWLGLNLREAMELESERYRYLRAVRPDDFGCTDAECWEGTYS